jgi:hypothetical protein
MGGALALNKEMINVYKISVGKPERTRRILIQRHRKEYTVKV